MNTFGEYVWVLSSAVVIVTPGIESSAVDACNVQFLSIIW